MNDQQPQNAQGQATPAAPCPYCRKPIVMPFSKVIFGRTRINGRAKVTETMMTFCSSVCASNEQMSREG